MAYIFDACRTLFENLHNKHTILLTPNQRLSAWLQKEFDCSQKKHEKKPWVTPQILPVSAWLESCYQILEDNGEVAGFLLSDWQEQMVWQQIVEETDHKCSLLNIAATVKQAKDAFSLLKQWQIKISEYKELFLRYQDGQLFYQWSQQFATYCRRNNFYCCADIPELIEQSASIDFSAKYIFVGFEELTPQIQSLFDRRALNYQFFNLDIPVGSHSVQAFAQEVDEIYAMAKWAGQQAGAKQIGCVVPNLSESRHKVLKIFSQVVDDKSFNISAGLTLAEYPLIFFALKLLLLASHKIKIHDLSCLLRSPFLMGAQEEMFARAELDIELKKIRSPEVALSHLVETTEAFARVPLFLSILQAVPNVSASLKPSEWAAIFANMLDTFGWPGERELNSAEYQQVQRWLELLSEYATLDIVAGKLSYQFALSSLKQLAEKTLFQEKTEEVSIQVLGSLEAAGLLFDKLWVMGMHNEAWPATPSPDNFIPIQLQRKFNMPHATAEREYQFSQKLFARFSQSANEVVFSYPLAADDREYQPCVFVEKLSIAKPDFKKDKNDIEKSYKPDCLEIFDDELGPSVTKNERVHGGSAILQSQAECPFKAFATFRLNAERVEISTLGFNHLERGSIIHKALEVFWQQIETQEKLLFSDDNEINKVIKESITVALRVFATQDNKEFIDVEQLRLTQLMLQWIRLEKQRSPFKVIATEARKSINFSGLKINIAIDRIDALDDGSQVIIDYKTGKVELGDWFGERPTKPQLPLYCITHDAISGVLYGCVQKEKVSFKGIKPESSEIPEAKEFDELQKTGGIDWQQQITQWNQDLSLLAKGFLNGEAEVDPKDLDKTCQYCHLHSLCRIYEGV